MDRLLRGATKETTQLGEIERHDRYLWFLTLTLMTALVVVVLMQYMAIVDVFGHGPWSSSRDLAVSLGGLVLVFGLFLLHRQRILGDLRRRFMHERVRAESLRSRLTEMSSLLDAVVRVRAPLDLEPALDTIAERMLASLSCDGCAVLLTSAETGASVVASQSGSFGGLVLPGKGVPGWLPSWDEAGDGPCVLSREHLFDPDRSDATDDGDLSLLLCAPLRVGERAIGTLLVARSSGRDAFSADEVASFGEFGLQLASVIDRISQFASLQRHAEELEGANRRLVDLNRMKRVVLSTVNHEVRTPLAGILSYTDMLLQDGDTLEPTTLREYHEIISGKANLLAEFVNELADLLSLESGRDGIHFYPASLEAIVSDARLAQVQAIARRGVRLETEIEEGLPLVHIDIEKLGRAVRFLVSNAVRFAEPGGRIRVTASMDPDGGDPPHVLLTIWDDGIGSRSGDLARVLSPEQARHRTMQHRVEALGLGYYLVREIVELHGGRVWTEEKEGGACIHLSLPAAPAMEAAAGGDMARVDEDDGAASEAA